jgi:hypothetical protein
MIKPNKPDEQEINLQQNQYLFIKLPGWSPENPTQLMIHLDGPQIKMLLIGPYAISQIHEDIRSSGYSQGLHITAHEVPHKQFIT